MKNIIVGTAGHVDHGKTALVKALTGIDADRLAEEKRRGITIDLGFAHIEVARDLRLGFVDVPGHERFVRNMLAGAGGIDLVLFVVAADASIQPQTREHFEICRLLGIRAGVVALTKTDAADPDILELTRLEVQEFLAGSFLASAPLVAVSARTGAGMDDLRAALLSAARAVPAKDSRGAARLPIDRAFALRGFGTVVTGTLLSGKIRKEQQLELLPGGRRLRVRALQTYGTPVDEAVAGTRTAVNVPDIEARALHRGMVLAEANRFHATGVFDASLELLPSAKPLKSRAPVHIHIGTAETIGEVRLFRREILEPGTTQLVRIVLKEPVVLTYGDRFIVRQFSPVFTLGGGVILDAKPGKRANERRLRVLASENTLEKIELLIDEAEWGIGVPDLAAQLSITPEEALRLSVESGAIILEQHRWVLDRARVQRFAEQLVNALLEYHRAMPSAPGMPKHDLRNRFSAAPVFVFEALLSAAPELKVDADLVRRQSHRPEASSQEQGAMEQLGATFEKAGFATPSVAEALSLTGLNQDRAKAVLQNLLRAGILCRISEEFVLHRSSVEQLTRILADKSGASFTVAEFKTWTGVSRKYAVPLLEFADRQKLTRRNGDLRTVVTAPRSK